MSPELVDTRFALTVLLDRIVFWLLYIDSAALSIVPIIQLQLPKYLSTAIVVSESRVKRFNIEMGYRTRTESAIEQAKPIWQSASSIWLDFYID